MQDKHRFSEDELRIFFSQLSIDEKALRLMLPATIPGGKKTYWLEYRKKRLTPANIRRGKDFLRDHRRLLQSAEDTFGIPGTVITAIIGIETRFGTYLGRFSIARALTTLALRHPTRAQEFQQELSHLLLYARETNADVLGISGSYAGAFGIPQFLPSSARRYAVDFNHDGRIDLFTVADAIGSIGNFLQQHGWLSDIGIAYPATVHKDPHVLMKQVADNHYRPVLSREDLAHSGVTFTAPSTHKARYLLIDLPNRYDTEYRVGTQNFYAITRYNKSFKYAAAVTDLAAAIA